MPNIMLTSKCNLHCTYCFARDAFSDANPNISQDVFERILQFIIDGGETHLGLIGGEPLLHPRFDQLLETVLGSFDAGNVILFTNGVYLDEHIPALKKSMIKLLINCNGEQILESQYSRFLNSLSLCQSQLNWRKSISYSYNLYDPNQNIADFICLIDQYPVETIRVAIASPDATHQSMAPSEYFLSMMDVSERFFSAINMRKIRVVMDCNILPNCLQNELISRVKAPFVLPFPKSVCKPILDFGVDQTVMRCFGLSDFRVSLERFSSIQQVYGYFSTICDFSAYTPSEIKCVDCFERKCMGCMNGCLSFSARRRIITERS